MSITYIKNTNKKISLSSIVDLVNFLDFLLPYYSLKKKMSTILLSLLLLIDTVEESSSVRISQEKSSF